MGERFAVFFPEFRISRLTFYGKVSLKILIYSNALIAIESQPQNTDLLIFIIHKNAA